MRTICAPFSPSNPEVVKYFSARFVIESKERNPFLVEDINSLRGVLNLLIPIPIPPVSAVPVNKPNAAALATPGRSTFCSTPVNAVLAKARSFASPYAKPPEISMSKLPLVKAAGPTALIEAGIFCKADVITF